MHYNAQGSRAITVVVQVGAVKIYVAAVQQQAFRKKEREDETELTTKNRWKKTSLGRSYFLL